MKKTALITGASKGIGKALASVFAKNGYSLLLAARNGDELREIQQDLQKRYQCQSKILPLDLAKPHSEEIIMGAFQDELPGIDVLINNAGLGFAKKFTNASMDEVTAMMEVNMGALTRLTYRILPHMLKRQQGKVLNVASTAAFLPGPYMAVYYASKAYALSFSEAIHEEYKKDGVVISALCPGMTKTAFQRRAGMEDMLIMKGLVPIMSPERVADIAYKGLMKNKRVIVPGFSNKMTIFLTWLLPSRLTAKVAARLEQPEKV